LPLHNGYERSLGILCLQASNVVDWIKTGIRLCPMSVNLDG
jgi:hypothetical protein